MPNQKKSRRTPRVMRTDYWRRPIADPTDALAELNEARARLVMAGIGDHSNADADAHLEMLKRLQGTVDEKKAAVDACFEKIRFTALRGDQFEELMAEHPPTVEDDENGLAHHDATFLPALAAACADNGWTVDDWVEEIAELSAGDRHDLRETVTHLNTRSWSSQVPKD